MRALGHISRGAFVCEYTGEVITTGEAERRGNAQPPPDDCAADAAPPDSPGAAPRMAPVASLQASATTRRASRPSSTSTRPVERTSSRSTPRIAAASRGSSTTHASRISRNLLCGSTTCRRCSPESPSSRCATSSRTRSSHSTTSTKKARGALSATAARPRVASGSTDGDDDHRTPPDYRRATTAPLLITRRCRMTRAAI